MLQGSVDDRKHRLDDSEVAQQYLFDAAEAEAFMGEQELFLMSDERAKVLPVISNSSSFIFSEQKHLEIFSLTYLVGQ